MTEIDKKQIHKKIFDGVETYPSGAETDPEPKKENTEKSQTFAPNTLNNKLEDDSIEQYQYGMQQNLATAVTAAPSEKMNFARGSLPVKSSSLFGFDTASMPSEAPGQSIGTTNRMPSPVYPQ